MRTSTYSLACVALLFSGASASGPSHGPKKPCPKPPHPVKELVSSEKLQDEITLEGLMAGANKLQAIADANGGNRVFGSPGHEATVDYLIDTLSALNYYNVTKQPFTELFSDGSAEFVVGGSAIDARIMTYTPAGTFDRPIVAASNLGCTAEDYPAEVAGNIALISRGECTFAAKSTAAKAAGAAAAVIYNNVDGPVAGTLGEASDLYAPIVGISQVDGQAILASLEAGEVTGQLTVESIMENRVTYNVIAETKGGDHDNVLVLGGHTDSVIAGPGINDDGSGTIGVLNIAIALSKFKIKNAIRFGFWSAEEYGLLGSYAYMKSVNSTESEVAKMRGYLNCDMIASPNYIYGIYDGNGDAFGLEGPAGSDVIERDFEEFFASKGVASVPTEFSGRSDYAAFIENGVPSGGLFTGAEGIMTEEEAALFGGQAGVAYDVNYHAVGDTVDNLAQDAFLLNTKAVAHSVAKYALSFDTLPAVNPVERRWSADRAQFRKRAELGAHSHGHSGPCGAKFSK
ncbi:aminopeptidase Y [Immersiella caudata]|uniref:Peptide hydrolase n=1 Tax=Immersiella caudata TaxID=314043 RepID=A0AA39WG48_9PEZI|nr:aminopeptidase Y [Immersiella caudata]